MTSQKDSSLSALPPIKTLKNKMNIDGQVIIEDVKRALLEDLSESSLSASSALYSDDNTQQTNI